MRCAVLLNAAAGLYVSGRGWTFEEAVQRAEHALEQRGRGERRWSACARASRGSATGAQYFRMTPTTTP